VNEPQKAYEMNFMDIIVVPKSVGRYRIKNLGDQPVVVYKVLPKPKYELGEITR